jgi:hypothetical protein
MLKNIGIALFIGFSISLYARDNVYYPTFFNSYFFNRYQVSPAYMPTEGKLECSGNYKSLLGELKKISAYSFSIARVFKSESNQSHGLRLSFFNEQEGSYISSPRAYIGYAYRQKLGSDFEIFSGINVGTTGLYYAAPTITQSSALLPDGAVSLGLAWKTLRLDLSAHHIFNSAKYVFTSPLVLERYFHGYLSYIIDLGPNLESKSYGLYRLLPYVNDEAYVATSLVYKKLFSVGTSVRYQSGLAFFTAFDLKNDRDRFQMFLNYNSAAFKLAPKWQTGVELGINYIMK